MAALTMGKTRPIEQPYLILGDYRMPGWEWRVLKAYTKTPDKPYSRWLCAVKSPYTYGGFDMGDTYITDCGNQLLRLDPNVDLAELPAILISDAEIMRESAPF